MPDGPGILIAGAGPTGLTAAVELARRGILPTIIDSKNGPSPLSRAVGVLPASMKLLAPSGVADAIRAEAVHVNRAVIHSGSHRIGQIALQMPGDPDYRMFALAQDRTEHHLRQAFERLGGRVDYGHRLQALSQDSSGVVVKINDEEHRFDHVVGADGVNSTVRSELGLEFLGYELPETWSIADVDATGWPGAQDFHAYLLGKGQAVIVVPLEEARFRVISNTEDALAHLPVPMQVEKMRRAGTFRISVRQVSRYALGRVYLAGDAAHCHSPVGGRGMNLGIADSADLALRFAKGDLDGYHAARHAEGSAVIALSERARRVIMSANPVAAALARLGVRVVSELPPLQRAATRTILGL